MILIFDGAKISKSILDLGEADTETVSLVVRAYGLVNATRGTNFRSRSEEE